MEIKRIPIELVNPATYNPRKDLQPSDPEYQMLEKSVDEFGLVQPLVWNQQTGNLVGGHQRLKILVTRGDQEVDVSVVDLSLEKEKALNLALNKISGDWDETKLADLLLQLVDVPNLDLEVTGFDLDEAQDLITDVLNGLVDHPQEDFDVDAALEADGPTITQPGDLILLGQHPDRQHKLLCGDCTDPEQVRRLMGGQNAALFATDPPYLVDYDKTWDRLDANPDLYKQFTRVAIDEAIQSNAAWYCWHASRRQAMLEQAWNEAGAFVHCQIIWTKNKGVPTRGWYMWQHEPCLMGWVKGNMPQRMCDHLLSTVWQIDTLPNGKDRPDHPTPKPRELFEVPMRQHTRPGDICYEPFAGSGTQFTAAQNLGRRCFGLEISPKYCDLIVRRYIAFAGEESVQPEVAERYRLPDKETAE